MKKKIKLTEKSQPLIKNLSIFSTAFFLILLKLIFIENLEILYSIINVIAIATFILVLLYGFSRKKALEEIGKDFFWARIGIYLVLGLALGGIKEILQLVFTSPDSWSSVGNKWELSNHFALALLLVMICFVEEILFRYLLYGTLVSNKIPFSGLITAALFCIFHLPTGIAGLLFIFFGAYVLNITYIKNRSWILNSFVHLGFNLHQVLFGFLVEKVHWSGIQPSVLGVIAFLLGFSIFLKLCLPDLWHEWKKDRLVFI